ncbi:MAG: prepilin-type N-terminal cleavage/methylation domain-containing protein [Syntrophales bacterium]
MMSNNRGFTLIEMIVVIGVIAVLTAIASPQLSAFLERGRGTTCLSMRYQTEKAEHAFIMEKNAPSGSFADLVSSGLLSRQPSCPSGGAYVWLQRTPQPILGCSIHYGAVPAEETENVLYASSFNGQSGLNRLMGNWNVAQGTLNNKPGQENRIGFGDTAWKDYEIKVSAVLNQGNGYGIYYRADGNANISGYAFQYDPGLGNRFVVRKVVNGSEQTPFQSVSMPAEFPVYNQSHDISITVVGDRTVIKMDNQTIMDFRDPSFASGSGGFRTWGSTEASFDNLSVSQK